MYAVHIASDTVLMNQRACKRPVSISIRRGDEAVYVLILTYVMHFKYI